MRSMYILAESESDDEILVRVKDDETREIGKIYHYQIVSDGARVQTLSATFQLIPLSGESIHHLIVKIREIPYPPCPQIWRIQSSEGDYIEFKGQIARESGRNEEIFSFDMSFDTVPQKFP